LTKSRSRQASPISILRNASKMPRGGHSMRGRPSTHRSPHARFEGAISSSSSREWARDDITEINGVGRRQAGRRPTLSRRSLDEGDEVSFRRPAGLSFVAMVNCPAPRPSCRTPEDRGFNLDPQALRRAISPRTRGIILIRRQSDRRGVLAEPAWRAGENPARGGLVGALRRRLRAHVYDGAVPHIFQIERGSRQGLALNSLSKAMR